MKYMYLIYMCTKFEIKTCKESREIKFEMDEALTGISLRQNLTAKKTYDQTLISLNWIRVF